MSYLQAIDPAPAALRAVPELTIVVPCHNEEAALPPLFRRLEALNDDLLGQGRLTRPLRLLLVDDGSSDRTWELIERARTTLPVQGLRLARNRGHQTALLAGLMQAQTEVVVSMDADLQDDPAAIAEMLGAYRRGAEIVFGVRDRRDSDTWFKRRSARAYYALLDRLGVDLLQDHADFRLMSRKALSALAAYGEGNLFLRGLVRDLGFQTEIVLYDRAARSEGESKYSLGKMLSLGIEGLTSFSVKPLRMIVLAGMLVAGLAFGFGLWSFVEWTMGRTTPGWASIVLPLSLLGGMHLIALGVIGEYVGKIYHETKRRPRYIIDEIASHDGATRAAPTLKSMAR
ncbi:glycosyltransferase family 2 protein [Salipiger sp. 1_MG-2023]|uniref:glycosyltransferase family 2 protein n=1 Tax=Salipiger sp. 1_MG-2023 TaxID=3062665 RepID=UPI0026E27540|nr:glycosyltransferase family 2 protein [Salipiger sp. 1_MG-2023]MDO6584722.1 glycosyltransferase family 2 protein [Salipiger sp. 1_MG-2023]